MEVIYYTCNYGNYDKWEYPEGTLVFSQDTGGRRESRFYKINSHLLPPHDVSVYFDGSRAWKQHPSKYAKQLTQEWLAVKHPVRHDLFQEINEVAGKLTEQQHGQTLLEKQKEKYKSVPKFSGLYENAVIVRKNTPQVRKINEMWWQEYIEGCERDQVSLPYVFWANNFKPQIAEKPENYFSYKGHA